MKLNLHFHIQKIEITMADNNQFEAQLARIEAAVSKILANQGGLNASQEDSALSRITSIADQLETVAPPTP